MFTPAQVSQFVASLTPGRTRYKRQPGQGQKRAAVRLDQHRKQQAARVAPALMALEAKRWLIADARVDRWQTANPTKMLKAAPGHIQAMAKETGA